ncbi:beta-ketoacyl synthase N-terminal-like domain-containing protein [uncultured Sutterella sp.]|uniref:beta-ketoacyl synthase N-terminal-like domain-containing protein n=1 Tax=uncultured Sutterella sp. TaxID=286133 RepID=UPI0025F0B99D|nr:beta-ketoacyl synthase N-terminal-like domain-containing protein [uncultured Sutterella sp.]
MTSSPKNPPPAAVLIPAARLLSPLGNDATETLLRLARPGSFPDEAALGRVPESFLEAARRTADDLGVPEKERTRTLLFTLHMIRPLVRRALDAGVGPAEIGFVFGGTAAGTPEVVEGLRTRPEAAPEEKWRLLEIGRTAPAAARILGICGPVITVSTACTAGAKAIAEGARLLRTGFVKAVVAGGLDVLSPLTEAGFSALGARSAERAKPFRADRSGLHLGEGGGFLLMTTDAERFPDAPVVLAGTGETSDAHHICAPEPEGRGAAEAVSLALGGRAPESVGFALLHGTATPQNDAMEAKALAQVLPGVPAASLKRSVGHQLAGAGAFNAAVAWAMLTTPGGCPAVPANFEEAPGAEPDPALPDMVRRALTRADQPAELRHPAVVASAFAFGGSNAALLFEARLPNTRK